MINRKIDFIYNGKFLNKSVQKILLFFVLLIACNCHAQSKRILLDSYFNDEHMKDASGNMISYHYKWEEKDNNGFYIFGEAFKRNGGTLHTLYEAPSPENLKQADVYII